MDALTATAFSDSADHYDFACQIVGLIDDELAKSLETKGITDIRPLPPYRTFGTEDGHLLSLNGKHFAYQSMKIIF
jgi:hypothetical protein